MPGNDAPSTPTFTARLDAWGRRHPIVTLVATAGLALVAAVLVLSSTGGTVVLYQAF